MKRKKIMYIGFGLALFGLCMLMLNWVGFVTPILSFAVSHQAIVAGLAASAMLGFTVEDKTELEKLLKEVGDKHRAAIQTEVNAAVAATALDKGFADQVKKDFDAKLETLGVKADVIKSLNDQIEKLGEHMRKLETKTEEKDVTIESIVEAKAEEIKKMASSPRGTPPVILTIPRKAILKTQVARSAVSGTTMAMRLLEIGQLPYLGMQMSGLFGHAPVSPSSGGFIRFYDQNAITRGAASVAEGATKPESIINWIERSLKIEKIADSIPVTKEAWMDVYFIQSEINRLLSLNLPLKEDALLWSGDGVTPNIKGVYTTAPVFDGSGASYAATIRDANIFDLAATMRVAIMNSKQSKYDPKTVVMNPLDILKYRLAKDEFGRYLFPTDSAANIVGMTVVESSQVTANTLLVGDFRYGTIYDLEDVSLEMGYINDQFVKNAMTLLAEKRLTLLIRNVDADAFLSATDITAQIALINKGV